MTNIKMQNEKGVAILHGQNRKKKIQMEQSDSDLGIMGCLRPKSHIEKYGMLGRVFEGWFFPLIASLSSRIPQVLGFLSIDI